MKTMKLYGPPGTGKTTTLLRLMEREIKKGVSPQEIAFLSFTNAACDEARERAMKKFNLKRDELPFFRTLHSICYGQLNVGQDSLITGVEQLQPFTDALGVEFSTKRERMVADDAMEFGGPKNGDKFVMMEHYRRHKLMDCETAFNLWPEDVDWFSYERFSKSYERWRDHQGFFDFTDLLEQVDHTIPVKVVFVDEAQDLSPLQWQALDVLMGSGVERVYIAGDDDQAIFTWAGASPELFVRRPADDEHVLGTSYRLPSTVHQLALQIISPVTGRKVKCFDPRDDVGYVDFFSDFEYAYPNIPDDGTVLVLYRNHATGWEAQKHLRHAGVPYSTQRGPAPGLQYAAAVRFWEHLRKGKFIGKREAIQTLRGFTKRTAGNRTINGLKMLPDDVHLGMDKLRELGLEVRSLPWFKVMDKIKPREVQYLKHIIAEKGAKGLRDIPRVRCSTIHGAKGKEADHVVLMTDMSPRVRETFERNPDSERRVFYVGVTRAINTLRIVGFDNPIFRGG